MTEREYRERLREYDQVLCSQDGAEAIQDLLKQVDLEAEIALFERRIEDCNWSKT